MWKDCVLFVSKIHVIWITFPTLRNKCYICTCVLHTRTIGSNKKNCLCYNFMNAIFVIRLPDLAKRHISHTFWKKKYVYEDLFCCIINSIYFSIMYTFTVTRIWSFDVPGARYILTWIIYAVNAKPFIYTRVYWCTLAFRISRFSHVLLGQHFITKPKI